VKCREQGFSASNRVAQHIERRTFGFGYSGFMRRLLVVGGAALLCVGCEALLGSFEVAPGGVDFDNEAGAEGGPGPGVDGGATTDAAADGGIPVQALKCALGQERLIENDPALPFDRFLKVFHTGNGVKIVAKKKGQSGPVIYSFDKGGSPPLKQMDLANAGDVLDVKRNALQSSLSLLMYERDAAGSSAARFVVWEVPDAPGSRPIRIPVSETVQLPFTAPNNSGVTGALGLYASAGEYFWAASIPSIERPGQGQAIVVGHTVPGAVLPYPTTIYEGDFAGTPRMKELFRSAQRVYLFDDKGPEPGSTTGGSYFQVPESPPNGVHYLPTSPRPLAAPGGKPLALMAAGTLSPPIGGRAVVAEIDFSGQGDVARILAGDFTEAELTSASGMNASKLPEAFSIKSLTEAPLDHGEMRLSGGDFLWIGGAQIAPPATGPAPGLNFMWFDIKAGTMRARQVGPDRLLLNHGGIVTSTATIAVSTPIIAELDIAWVEENPNMASTLYYAQMSCVK
jgi:hypothetical protein